MRPCDDLRNLEFFANGDGYRRRPDGMADYIAAGIIKTIAAARPAPEPRRVARILHAWSPVASGFAAMMRFLVDELDAGRAS